MLGGITSAIQSQQWLSSRYVGKKTLTADVTGFHQVIANDRLGRKGQPVSHRFGQL